MREVAAEFERPVLLFSGGKDSIVLLRLAEKAFRPAPLPVPAHARRHGPQLPRGDRVPRPPRGRARRAADRRLACRSRSTHGRVGEETGPRASRNRLQTVTLLDAIAEHGFDAAFGGARRDEERARAKERIFSLPRRVRPVGPEAPAARAVEPLQRPHPARRARARVPALELDRARRLAVHRRRGARAARRSTSRTTARSSSATACCWPLSPFVDAARRARRRSASVRYRTVGDIDVHRRGASDAATLDDGDRGDRRHAHHRARRDARRRPRLRSRDGRPQARGLLLMPGTRQLLRFATAGSVDDGKSTLIGRLLLRLQVDLRGPARGASSATSRSAATTTSTSRCSPTACAPSASRASRSTSPTATSRRRSASSSSPTPRATCSTRATWSPARRPPTSRSC